MSIVQRHVVAFALAATTAQIAAGQSTSTDIFTARPPRVDRAEPGQSAAAPGWSRVWDHGAAVPVTRPQEEILLTREDPLALWVPTKNSTTDTGSITHHFEGAPSQSSGQFEFDLYRRDYGLAGDALTGPIEQGYWIGLLDPGAYEFELRIWDLPDVSPLAPPGPWQDDLGQAVLAESYAIEFIVVPEPTRTALAAWVALAAIRGRRMGRLG